MTACSPSGPTAPRAYQYAVPLGQTFDLAAGRVLTEAEEAQRFAGAVAPRLVFLGEHHADPRSQAFQARFLRALAAQGHPVTVALEMFPPQADGALEAWRQGRLAEADFVEQSRWYETWGFPWTAYRPLFEAIRDARLPTHGINVDEATRKAVRESPTGALPPDLKTEIGDLDLTVTPHRDYFLDSLTGAGRGDPAHAGRESRRTPASSACSAFRCCGTRRWACARRGWPMRRPPAPSSWLFSGRATWRTAWGRICAPPASPRCRG